MGAHAHPIDYDLARLLATAVRMGYQQCLVDFGKLNPKMSQRAATRALGNSEARLRRCEGANILKPTKKSDAPNGKIGYDLTEVEIAKVVSQ